MKLVLVVLVTGLALIPVSGVATQTFSFDKTGDIPLDLSDEIVGQIADLMQDAEGKFYLTDWQQNTVWMCDADGRLIRRLGREGSGPGEVVFPLAAAVFEDRVFVLDTGNSRVVVFKKDGTYVNDFRLNFFMTSGILVSENGQIAVNSLWDQSLYTVYDMEGTTIGSHGKREPDTRLWFTMGDQHFSRTPDGHILYSTLKQYPVYRMAWDGTVLATYAADSPGYGPFEFPDGNQIQYARDLFREMYKTWTPILRPLAVKDHVLVQRKKVDFETGREFYGDLFTMDGTPVQLALELPLQFYAADGDLLYGIDNTPVNEGADNPYIVVYRLSGGS